MRVFMACVVWGLLQLPGAFQARAFQIGNHPLIAGGMRTNADPLFHYEPVPGKLVGIYMFGPPLEAIIQLRQQFGFTGLNLEGDSTQYQNALTAGFQVGNMVMSMHEDNAQIISRFAAGMYYIDEAVEHDCSGSSSHHLYSPDELAAIRANIQSTRPGAKFATSGYKPCSHLMIASTYCDVVMFSSYKNWSEFSLPICHVNMGWGDEYERPWIPGSADQRNSWTTMRNLFGTKFSMTWMTASGDEYSDLFQHANTLGLNAIWLYDPNPYDSTFFESFCSIAWQNGWLNRVLSEPLPIQLSSFSATQLSGQRVLLQWTTLSEINNYGFEVQRRRNTSDEFETLPGGLVPGHGTTNEPHHYSFIDSLAPSDHPSYRLKQIDLDGSIHYSDPIVVTAVTGLGDYNPYEFVLYQNYPNPFNPSTTITFQIANHGLVSLKVFDVLGREVAMLANEEMMAGRYEKGFDGSGLASGVYICQLHAGGFVQNRKLLLSK